MLIAILWHFLYSFLYRSICCNVPSENSASNIVLEGLKLISFLLWQHPWWATQISPPNNTPPPTTLWHPLQTTHPIQVLQEPASNWDNREDAFINICTETLTLTQTAGTCSHHFRSCQHDQRGSNIVINWLVLCIVGFWYPVLKSLRWSVSNCVFSFTLHNSLYPTLQTVSIFRNQQEESCHAIWFLRAVNASEVGKGGLLPVKLLCHSEVWHCYFSFN